MEDSKLVEVEEKYSKEVQLRIDKFKVMMKEAAEEILGQVYVDCMNFAAGDAIINYHNHLRDEFRFEVMEDVLSPKYGHYSWGASIRKDLLKNHQEELRNAIISDLRGEVKSLEERIEQLYRYRY